MTASTGIAKKKVNGLPAYCFEDLREGMSAEYRRVITQSDVEEFARISGDINPLHLDKGYASKTFFKGRVVHGMCTASLISTVLGTRMPGPGCVYISQSLRFRAPVRAGDEVVARATVRRLQPEKNRVTFATDCIVDGKVVLEGEAVIQVPSRPQTASGQAAG